MKRQSFQDRMKGVMEKEPRGKALADHLVEAEKTETPQKPHRQPIKKPVPQTTHRQTTKKPAPRKTDKRTTMKKYHVRFQEQDWAALRRHFEARGISVSAGLRMVVLDYMAKGKDG